jgi:predicted transcriptional regulator of viral defense system
LSRTERYQRSDIERTLVDCCDRPEMVASTEMWVLAWGRALQQGGVSPERLCDYALRLGGSAPRRVGLLLELAGYGIQARDLIPVRARRTDRQVALIADGIPLSPDQETHDFWRVYFNVPRRTVEGWLHYAK